MCVMNVLFNLWAFASIVANYIFITAGSAITRVSFCCVVRVHATNRVVLHGANFWSRLSAHCFCNWLFYVRAACVKKKESAYKY